MGKIPTYKENRFGTEPKPKYDDNAKSMARYHKEVIFGLARNYKGKKLKEKLSELKFCSLETALEVLHEGISSL